MRVRARALARLIQGYTEARKSGRMAGCLRDFWQRISDGVAIQKLWVQFRAEARASYEL